jgi:hypothetical protein
LDNQTDYISSENLLFLLGYSNITQVKKLCKKLQDDIKECYTEKEMTLVINKRHGIRLLRHPTCSFQDLFNLILSEDIAYCIFKEVLIQRVVSVKEFRDHYFVSFSTIKRKVKEINNTINDYNLHITVSHQLKIRGKESAIRCFSFFILFMMHRQLSNIPWIENKERYFNLAKQISQSLNLNFSFVQEEILGLQLFISCSAIERKHHFHFTEINFPFVTEIKFPTKPNFLTDWSNEEWHFLLLMVHNSNLSNYIIPLDFSNVPTPELDHDYKLWITLFEKHVAPFDDTQAEFIYQNFIRLYLGSFFFKIDQKLLLSFPGIGFNIKKNDQSYFFSQVQKLWYDFSEQCGTWTHNHFETQSVLLCQYLLSAKRLLPKINIYLYTDLSDLFLEHIKNGINSYFASKYNIVFVNKPEESDLIVGTIKYPKMTNPNYQHQILIQGLLTQQDYQHLVEIIKELLIHNKKSDS